MFKLIDTTEPPIPPVDNEPKIKSFGSFRWLVTNYSVVRKLKEKLSGDEIDHFCPYDYDGQDARWFLLCESTYLQLEVNS